MHQSKKQIIISGLLSVFLVTTLAITSSLINNPNFSLDIRNYAASLEKEELAYLKNVYKPPATTQTQQPAKAVVTKAVVNKTDEGDSEAALRANLAATATQAQAVAAEQAQVAAAKLAAQKAADAKALQEEEATLRANLSTPVPSPTTTTTTVTSKDEDINGNSLNSTTTYTNTTSTNPTTGQTVQTTTISDVSANNPTVSQNATLVKTTNSDKTTNTAITSSTTNNSTISQIEKTDEGFIKTDTTIKRDVTTGNIVAANSTSKLLESDKDRLTKLYQDKTCGGLKTGESCVPIQGTAQYGITQNSGATAISYNSGVTAGQPTSVPVVTNAQESQSFWQQLGSKFNDASNDTGLVGMGTGGLGMDGNTTAIPLSVITSDDPEAVNNYLVGSSLAVAAGAGTAALTVGAVAAAPVVASSVASTGTAIYTLAGGTMTTGTLSTIPTAALAYGSATLSTAVAALPAAAQTGLAVAGTTAALAAPALGMNQCVQSGDPGSPACVGIVTGYMSNPLEVEYALSDSINSVKSIVTKPTIATSNLPDFNLNVSTTHLPGYNNNDVLIEQVSNRVVTIKTGGQYISMDLDDPKLAKIVNESTNELAGLQGEDYWDKLYDIRGRFGESEFATSTEKNAYDIAQDLAVKTNTPIPLSEILEKKQAICLELSCILSLVNGNAENKIKTMAVDIFVPANGFELGHAANSSLTSDPINRLDNFNPIFNQENIGAIQRVNFWSE